MSCELKLNDDDRLVWMVPDGKMSALLGLLRCVAYPLRPGAEEMENNAVWSKERHLESLYGLLMVDRVEEPPPAVFALVADPAETSEEILSVSRPRATEYADGEQAVPKLALKVEEFARMNALSPELQKAVREELEKAPVDEKELHPRTYGELYLVRNAVKQETELKDLAEKVVFEPSPEKSDR